MKTPVQMFHAGIAVGMSGLAAVMVFAQDLMGLDRWVEFISNNWTSFHWSVGLVAILWTVASYFFYRRQIR